MSQLQHEKKTFGEHMKHMCGYASALLKWLILAVLVGACGGFADHCTLPFYGSLRCRYQCGAGGSA